MDASLLRPTEQAAEAQVQPPAPELHQQALEVALRQLEALLQRPAGLGEDQVLGLAQPPGDGGLAGVEELGQLRLRHPVAVVEAEQLPLLVSQGGARLADRDLELGQKLPLDDVPLQVAAAAD